MRGDGARRRRRCSTPAPSATRSRRRITEKYAGFRTEDAQLPDATRAHYAVESAVLRLTPVGRLVTWDNSKLRLQVAAGQTSAAAVSFCAGLTFVPFHSGMSSPTLAAGILSSWTTAQCEWLSSCMVKQACSEL